MIPLVDNTMVLSHLPIPFSFFPVMMLSMLWVLGIAASGMIAISFSFSLTTMSGLLKNTAVGDHRSVTVDGGFVGPNDRPRPTLIIRQPLMSPSLKHRYVLVYHCSDWLWGCKMLSRVGLSLAFPCILYTCRLAPWGL